MRNYLNNPEKYGLYKGSGRPKIFSSRQARALLRAASNSSSSARVIAESSGIQGHLRTVQRVIKNCGYLVHKKIKRKPQLRLHHQENRLNFAKQYMSWTEEWRSIIFSDEKRFNLDGPDGFSYYYHDIRKEEKILSKRQNGGGSVMIWAAIGYEKNSEIEFLSQRVSAKMYKEILGKIFSAYGQVMAGEEWIFQQDNAPIHTAKVVQDWFREKNINVLNWPALYPDLNPIENVWGWLAREVYKDGCQYSNIQELKAQIIKSWGILDKDQVKIQSLYDSMKDRIF